ncbi:MAG: LD-carboxypeptidase [Candidatus Micrarchaeota archaeon]|nr:LD-carboxypeptidase [Candidatus Micrarchaeota archaeon]MDE1848239.1 LD-carboxypeptidase [Candidatus Micrarchaeota archaeon]MDE1864907.1 LD-carboxypeptidase [Candidatus Micrarchaeota archaeon]
MIPAKLKPGDEIRVISPSESLSTISQEVRRTALENLTKLGFKVTYSAHSEEADEFASSPIGSRVEDLHNAFTDKNVKGIMSSIGGLNANQILDHLDYGEIRSNPKVLCGYSDLTVLQNAIFTKAGMVSYYGPHFSSLGMINGLEYTLEYFKKCLIEEGPFSVGTSKEWSNDEWYIDQHIRHFMENRGYTTINPGEATGRILGGNLSTFGILQGTKYMPDLSGSILFLEEDGKNTAPDFDRSLQSLVQQPRFEEVRGLVIGRFENMSRIPSELLSRIIKGKKELSSIPVIGNVDFGHTVPQFTFPIGGTARISVGPSVEFKILEH